MFPCFHFRRGLAALLICLPFASSARAQTPPITSEPTVPQPTTPAPATPVAPANPVVPAPAPATPTSPLTPQPTSPTVPERPLVPPNTTPPSTGNVGPTSEAPSQTNPANNIVPTPNADNSAVTATAATEAATPTDKTATTDKKDAEPKSKLPQRGTMEVTGDADAMSVFAVGVDAPKLLTAIAARANLKLVVDDTVSRQITISVKGKPAREIISSIAGAYGLAAADVGGVLLVSEGIPRSPSSYLLSDIDQISTKYVDAQNARNLLPSFLQDYVKVNSSQNAVVLSAPAEVLRKFREDIAGFDIPAAQITVDLLLVEFTETGLDQLNLNLSYSNAGGQVNFSPSQGSLSYRSLTTLPDQFLLQISALQQQGQARVRANPRIATVSGRRASIFVGRQRYIVTPIDTGNGQRNFIDAGVRLQITPYTGGEKQILVDVDTEVSTLSALDPVTRLPEKSTRTANTRVRVDDGQTLIIGGLRQQETRNVTTKVPILGDLPLLGPLLFRSRNKRTTNTELVLFITPRLLSDTGHLPADEEKKLKDRFLAPDLSAPLPAPKFERPKFETPFGGDDGDAVRRDAVRRDAVRRDAVRRDAVRRDAVRRDAVRRRGCFGRGDAPCEIGREAGREWADGDAVNVFTIGIFALIRSFGCVVRDCFRSRTTRFKLQTNQAIFIALAIFLLVAVPARAQLATSYLTVTGIKVNRLTNAVQVRIETDGLPRFGTDLKDLIYDEYFGPKPTQSFHVRIVGAISRLPTYVPIDAYPIDGAVISPGRTEFGRPFFTNGAGNQPEPRVDIEFRFATPVVTQQFAVNVGDDGIRFGQYADPLEFSLKPSSNGRAIVLTIFPDRSDLNGAARLDRSPVADRTSQLDISKNADGTLRVLSVHTPLRDLLEKAGAQSGVQFLARDDVAALDVSLFLPATSLAELLDTLQNSYNLGGRIENGALVLGRGDEFQEARSLPLFNLAPDAARLLFPDFLLAALRPDRRGNALVATGSPAILSRITADLKRIDAPRAQFEITAQIWEINSVRDVNVLLQLTRSVGRDRQTLDIGTGEASIRVERGQTDQLLANLQLLSSRGRGRLRATPRVTVLAGANGSIFLGQTRYVLVLQQRGSEQVSQALPLQIGTKLNVTARGSLNPDDPISLDVAPSVSTVDALENGTSLPTIGIREVNSTVLVDSDQSVIIAGLESALESETRGKALKVLPSRLSNREQQQLLILVKARRIPATS